MALLAPGKGIDTSPEKKTGFTFRGKEIVIGKQRGKPLQGLKAKGMLKNIFPEEKRIEVVTLYAVTGDMKKSAELAGVPYHFCQQWKKTPWFKDMLEEVRDENDALTDAKYNEIVVKTLDQIVDRLENGEVKMTKMGDLVRVPVALRDAVSAHTNIIEKRELLRGKPTSRSVSTSSDDKLAKLGELFKELAGKKRPVQEITDAEYTEIPNEPSTS
jgi:hypothetical protein